MLQKYINFLENDEHPLLGPTLWGLSKWGIWMPKSNLSAKIYCAIHIIATLFVFSQFVELWLIRSDLDLALRNLSVTMLSTICTIKAGTFIIRHENWKDILEYVSKLEKEQLLKNDKITNRIINEYKKYSRRVTYFYWCLVAATVLTVVLAPLLAFWSSEEYRGNIREGLTAYPEIMSSWLPFDRTKGLGYWASVVEHVLICVYGGGVIATYDTNAVVLMNFFAGQLKLLNVNCSRLFSSDKKNIDKHNNKILSIKELLTHHLSLTRYAKILDDQLSPVMFLYVIVCSLMICSSAIQLTKEGTTSMQRIWLAEYLVAIITQLFLYCWHSNEVLIMSIEADRGIYYSGWWRQNVRLRRCVLILAGRLRKTFVFSAGPFTKLNLATFIAILKGAYSYYTILSNKDN
ncbi:hypothetical protein ACJJTC_014643 [Scirpophaga incertulas]